MQSEGGGAKKQHAELGDEKHTKKLEEEEDHDDGNSKMEDSVTVDHHEEHAAEQEVYEGGDYIPGDYDDSYNDGENGDFEFEFY